MVPRCPAGACPPPKGLSRASSPVSVQGLLEAAPERIRILRVRFLRRALKRDCQGFSRLANRTPHECICRENACSGASFKRECPLRRGHSVSLLQCLWAGAPPGLSALGLCHRVILLDEHIRLLGDFVLVPTPSSRRCLPCPRDGSAVREVTGRRNFSDRQGQWPIRADAESFFRGKRTY